MFEMLSTITADIAADILSGTGPQGRARKAVLTYRREQTPEAEKAALEALNALEQNVQKEIRSKTKLRH